jgi:two-component system osmolarity sensor histidine kinase EnvZ
MKFWPRSMLGRNLALLVPLVVASQACALAVWLVFVQQPRTDEAASLVASQIMMTDRLLSVLSPDDRRQQLASMDGVPTSALSPTEVHSTLPEDYVLRRFFGRLLADLPPAMQVRWQEKPDGRLLWVRLRASDELWVALPIEGAGGRLGLTGIFLILLSLTTFPTLGAYLIHRRVEGPLEQLARAARDIERGQWPPAVRVQGPRELATVIESFNRMAATLADSEAARAEMLAGISHDIRTPLTKLRMLAAAPEMFEEPAASAERFIEEIDAVVGQFIDFARGSDSEKPEPGDLNALVEQLAGGYTALGHAFELDLQPLPKLSYRPVSMQRLLMNLMQNAVVYGRTALSVRSRLDAGTIEIAVEDRGPGVPPDALSMVKQPFRRVSRGNEKGTGLGLAIAERTARQHGGTLDLVLRDGGGLSAVVRLPVR